MEVRASIEHMRFLPPSNINTFGIPNDATLKAAYETYKPSRATRKLKSEQGRKLYAEAFIESENLGTLADLSVRAMARDFQATPLIAIVSADALKWRIYHDALSVDLPLEKCYQIDDESYWRRVVLTKSKDKTFTKVEQWKNLGISLKFVELIESQKVEYWPEKEIEMLAVKIKDFIKEMHIKRPQSLQDFSFKKYFEDSSTEESSDESEDESFRDQATASVSHEEASNKLSTIVEAADENLESDVDEVAKTESELEAEKEEAEIMVIRAEELATIKAAKLKARQEREERRRRRAEKKLAAQEVKPPSPPVTTRRKRQQIKGVFDIPIEEDEDDIVETLLDRRKLSKLLERKKKYKYPAKHCHHVDLSFLHIFENLQMLTIEFLGPIVQRDFHTRHFNFSYLDMEHLASGISRLEHLRTFRLRNSRMDARKLDIITTALQDLRELETVDFGNDQLNDDCGYSLYKLFKATLSIKALELEGNSIGSTVLKLLAKVLATYKGNLEYLGLAHNPLPKLGFHAFINAIIGTEHVSRLCLTATHINQETIACCIANELLRLHKPLRRLDLIAVSIGPIASVELIKALDANQTILHCDCRACDLDLETETDIESILQRNRHILENPFINDDTKTEEEINAWVTRMKNPILLNVLAKEEQRLQCREQMPDVRFRTLTTIRSAPSPKIAAALESVSTTSESSEESEGSHLRIAKQLFGFDPNNFDEKHIRKHAFPPGFGPNMTSAYFK